MHSYRSHTCGALSVEHVGQVVRLSGWVHRKRDHGGVLFVDLRDHYGITQIVADSDSPALAILDAALGRLAPGGTLLLYTGAAVVNGHDPFRAEAEERLAAHPGVGWTYREMDPDVFGEELDTAAYLEADRIAAVVLTVTRKG